MRAIFAGTFDPFTTGHADIVRRSAACFSEVVVAVAADGGKCASSGTVRTEIAELAVKALGLDNVKVMPFCGLLTDFSDSLGGGVLVRGVRNAKDFEYESELYGVYKSLNNTDVVIFITAAELAHVSSTVVRQLAALGAPLDGYIVKNTEDYIRAVYGKADE